MTPERKAKINRVLNNRQHDLTIVLEDVHDPHNIAAVMRSCDAVGVQELHVIITGEKKHDYFGKRSSATAASWLTIHQYNSIEECMTVVKGRYSKLYATHLGSTATSLYSVDLTEPVALVFGNEHAGISEACLSYCDGNFIIPQVGMIHSLNISVACAVSLYEAFRQRSAKGFYSNDKARMPEVERRVLAEKWKLEE